MVLVMAMETARNSRFTFGTGSVNPDDGLTGSARNSCPTLAGRYSDLRG
jgi:hypothetical protein